MNKKKPDHLLTINPQSCVAKHLREKKQRIGNFLVCCKHGKTSPLLFFLLEKTGSWVKYQGECIDQCLDKSKKTVFRKVVQRTVTAAQYADSFTGPEKWQKKTLLNSCLLCEVKCSCSSIYILVWWSLCATNLLIKVN